MAKFVEAFATCAADIISVLGDVVTVTPQAGDVYQLPCIFDTSYQEVTFEGAVVNSNKPKLTCRSADIVVLERGDSVTFEGVDYKVINIEDEDVVITTVYLHKK